MLDTRAAFDAICTQQNYSGAAHYMERVFGFHDIEFADDTNFVHTHLLSLRTLTTCYLKESCIHRFRVNNDPETGKCCVVALNLDLPHVVIFKFAPLFLGNIFLARIFQTAAPTTSCAIRPCNVSIH